MQKGFAQIIILVGILVIAAISGAFYLGKQTSKSTQPQAISQATPSPSQDTNPTPNGTGETANWKTYTNNSLGFSFKYPVSWNLDSANDTSVSLSTKRSTTDKAGGDYTPGIGWLNFDVSNEPTQKVVNSTSGVEQTDQSNINGTPYTRLMGHSGVGGSVYFVNIIMSNNGRTYIITLSTQDSKLEELLTSEFDQILSTFKFTN